MRILVTNDDGIHAPGLETLERIARTLSDDVWIVAPAEENSGAGHSLSLAEPIRYRKIAAKRFEVCEGGRRPCGRHAAQHGLAATGVHVQGTRGCGHACIGWGCVPRNRAPDAARVPYSTLLQNHNR